MSAKSAEWLIRVRFCDPFSYDWLSEEWKTLREENGELINDTFKSLWLFKLQIDSYTQNDPVMFQARAGEK